MLIASIKGLHVSKMKGQGHKASLGLQNMACPAGNEPFLTAELVWSWTWLTKGRWERRIANSFFL